MAYRLQADESVHDGFRRCAADQLDRAVSELSERIGEDPVAAVHRARKAVKKERSLLRLVRGSMPARQRRKENRRLRDAARGLSAARDAEVTVATLDDLSERYAGQLPESAFEGIREPLVALRDEQRAALIDSTLSAEAVGELGAARLRVEGWRLAHGGWAAVQDGLRRAYADSRRAYRRARSHRSGTEWHEWRKRVKDLWYQQRLLADVCGPVIAGQARDAHRLADLLGDEHDLGVLREALTARPVPASVDVDAVIRLIDHRREELQRDALWLGARIHTEKPRVFIGRMRRTWKAGRGLAGAGAAESPIGLAEATRAAHPA